jgi:23S rRNA pseudouridine2457 synthase
MLIAFNKPYGVICQFSPSGDKPTLKDYIALPGVYPAGRLDTDSEGLMLLTDDGVLQAQIADPRHKLTKMYLAQVEGLPVAADLEPLRRGLDLGDFVTQPASVKQVSAPAQLWDRQPPIRFRKQIPASWLEITISEGKNRQVRRMTAKIGFPTLRLVRIAIGAVALGNLAPGSWRKIDLVELALRRTKKRKNPEK